MTQNEALKLALEALELHGQQYPHMVKGYCLDAITAIKEVLAQPAVVEQHKQEPVTDEENEKFSQDVSNFKGADPEATKYALEAFLKNRALAQPEHEKERCVGCEACIDTACGRDECPKGWPKAAQPEQELMARSDAYDKIDRFLQNNLNSDADYAEYSKALDSIYTTPPQRKPLTDEEIGAILEGVNAYGTRLYTFARAIEAKLKEKNT